MQFRTTGLLLLCVIVAGGLFWWSRGAATDARPMVDAPRLVPGKVLGVRVRFASRDYELRQEGDGWVQSSPMYFPVTREAGLAWVAALAALRPVEQVQPGVGDTPGLAELALAPPVAELTVITDDGAVELALGDQTLAGTGYVRLDDGRTVLVPDAIHNLVYGPPPAQSFAGVLPLPPLAALDTVTMTQGRDSVTLHRLAKGWSLLPDAMRRVRPEVVEALAALTDHTPVLRHQDDANDPARYGLQPPRASLSFTGPDRAAFTLDLGRSAAIEQGAIFARLTRDQTPGPIVALPTERAKIAFAPLRQLRDPRLLDATAEQVRELTVARPGQPPVTLVDRGDGLAFADNSDPTAVTADALVAAVLALRSTEPIAAEVALPGDGVASVTVAVRWGVTGSAEVTLYRGPMGWAAQRSDEPDTTGVTDASIARLLALIEPASGRPGRAP